MGWHKKAAEQGHAYSIIRLYELEHIGTTSEVDRCFQLLLEQAKKGSPLAQMRVGHCYDYALGFLSDIIVHLESYRC